MAVDTGSDPEGKHVGLPETVSDEVKGLFFDGHITIRYNDHAPGGSLVRGKGQGPLQGRQEFGAATAPLPFDQGNRTMNVFRGRRKRLSGHQRGAPCKEEHIKPVGGTEVGDQVFEEFLGNVQGKSVHGARDIHDEDILSGRYLFGCDPFGRLQHGQKKIFFFAFIEKESGLDPAASELVFEQEIPVAAEFVGGIELNAG